MRSIRPPTRGLRAALVAVVGVAALLAATIAPVAAAEPGPTSVPALSGIVRDACTGLLITSGLTVTVAPFDPATGQTGSPVAPPTPPANGFFSYPSLDPGSDHFVIATVSDGPYGSLRLDLSNSGTGPLPPGQSVRTGLLLDIELMPANPTNPCPSPASPLFPAVVGRGVDSTTGRGLRGLAVGIAALVADPTTGLIDPGPLQMPSGAPILGLFRFRTLSPGPIGFQFYATAPGHTSLGADPTRPPGPGNLGPGVKVIGEPGPISLPAGSGSVSVSVVLSVALPAGPAGG